MSEMMKGNQKLTEGTVRPRIKATLQICDTLELQKATAVLTIFLMSRPK